MKKNYILALLMAFSSLSTLKALTLDESSSYHKQFAYAWLGVGTAWAGFSIYCHYSDFTQERPNATFGEYLEHLRHDVYKNKEAIAKRAAFVGLVACAGHGLIYYNTDQGDSLEDNKPGAKGAKKRKRTAPRVEPSIPPRTSFKPSAELERFTNELRAQLPALIASGNNGYIATLQDELRKLQTDAAELRSIGALGLLAETQAAIDRKQAQLDTYEREKRIAAENPPHFYVGHVRGLLQQRGVDCGFYASWFTNQFVEKIDINNPASFSEFIASVSQKSGRAAFDAFFAEKVKELDAAKQKRIQEPPVPFRAPEEWEGTSAWRLLDDYEIPPLLTQPIKDLTRDLEANPCVSVCRPQNLGEGHWASLGVIQVPTGVANEFVRVYVPLNSTEAGGKYASGAHINENIVNLERSVFKRECVTFDGRPARPRPQTVAEALKTYDATMDPRHKAFLTEVLRHLDV